jgi:hypothetical protein
VRDLAHAVGAGRPVQEPDREPDPVRDRNSGADQGKENGMFLEEVQRRASP